MKITAIFLGGLMLVQLALAQSSHYVTWDYKAKKIGDKRFAVHMTATIKGGYHLYAQDAGGNGMTSTHFSFVKTPLLILDGKVEEQGKLITKFDPTWEHALNYYEKTVDFVQVVKLKGEAKTNLAGKVGFMVCNDRLCERPSEEAIKVNIGG